MFKFSRVQNFLPIPKSNDESVYDPDYDEEVNRLLDEVEEELLHNTSKESLENYDFSEITHYGRSIPDWYQKMLQSKMEVAKNRLKKLRNLVCADSPITEAHIKRIEEDHSTTFCKMDFPRHPPMDKLWTDFWSFNGRLKCKEINNNLNHAHTRDCLIMIDNNCKKDVPVIISNSTQHDYSQDVIDTVKLFKDFFLGIIDDKPRDITTVYDIWNTTRLIVRRNRSNDFIIVIIGKITATSMFTRLETFFKYGPGKNSKAKSVFYFDKNWTTERKKVGALLISGNFELEDKVGPISIHYDSRNCHYHFNSVETMQLDKIVQDYLGFTRETTLLDIGCGFGVLSLMLANKCEKVIGLSSAYTTDVHFSVAERLKKINNIHNVSFIGCNPKDILTTCSPLVKERTTVAILNLSAPYCKNNLGRYVIKALRKMPSIWRVLIYGSFSTEFHEDIAMLTTENKLKGKHFLPMQGCILDKSPSVTDFFNVVILFERKSLAAPKIELLAPGLTLNVDSAMYNRTVSSSNVRFVSEPEKVADNQHMFLKPSVPVSKDFRFVRPPPLVGVSNQLPILHPLRSFEDGFQFRYPPPSLPVVANKCQYNYPPPPIPIQNGFQFNYPPPSLPLLDGFSFNYPPPLIKKCSSQPFFPYPPPPFNHEFQYNIPPPPYKKSPFLSENQLEYEPPLPLERYPSPPPPPPPSYVSELPKKIRFR